MQIKQHMCLAKMNAQMNVKQHMLACMVYKEHGFACLQYYFLSNQKEEKQVQTN